MKNEAKELGNYIEKVCEYRKINARLERITYTPESYSVYLQVEPKLTTIVEFIKPSGSELKDVQVKDNTFLVRFDGVPGKYREEGEIMVNLTTMSIEEVIEGQEEEMARAFDEFAEGFKIWGPFELNGQMLRVC